MCARSSSRCARLGHDSVASRATHEVVVTAAGGRALLAALLLAWVASARAEDTPPLAWLKSGNYQALDQYYSRQQRDYVWIMARAPDMPEADYQRLVKLVGERGYDLGQLRKVPQQWKK